MSLRVKGLGDIKKLPIQLPLEKEEKMVLTRSGSLDVGTSLVSTWKLCNIALTTHRLFCYQARKIFVSIPLKNIVSMKVVKRGWILRKRIKQLFLELSSHKHVFLGVAQPEIWLKVIEGLQKTSEDAPCPK